MVIQPHQFHTHSLEEISRGDDICRILAAAICGADAGEAIKRHVHREADSLVVDRNHFDLNIYQRILVIGAGKASVPMAKSVCEIVGNRLTSGMLITKDGYRPPLDGQLENKVQVIEGSHPLPEQRNVVATLNLLSLVKGLNNNDLVIFLLSGGASSLLMCPSPGISLHDIQLTTSLLLDCGASIAEINTVRKHSDAIKGGGLAKLLAPATVTSLILSDVVGDQVDMIGSGPTTGDLTTYADTWAILIKYQLVDRVPTSVREHIADGLEGKIPETLKPGDPILKKVTNHIVASNKDALTGAEQAARMAGFSTSILTSSLQGEASAAGDYLCGEAEHLLAGPSSISRPACMLAGGETTVGIKGKGLGGRNQELALGAVKCLSGMERMLLVSLATDGGDGPTDAAGAVATSKTYSRGLSMSLNPQDYLRKNDSFHYFEPLGDLIKTGPTFTNVNDLVLIFGL
jgi:glycerate 2-kinase